MSLRDRLRRRQPGSGQDSESSPADVGDADAAGAVSGVARDDVTDFEPRSEGDYHCADRGLYLRFARPAVTETSEQADGAHPDPARGEFTSSGRFVVQRRFGRPVVYTVLETGVGMLLVRRTDTAVPGAAGTEELWFTFEPDTAG